jgi:hypothetical protein
VNGGLGRILISRANLRKSKDEFDGEREGFGMDGSGRQKNLRMPKPTSKNPPCPQFPPCELSSSGIIGLTLSFFLLRGSGSVC